MIDLLRDLAGTLARDSITVDEVVRRVGPIGVDHGRGGALELASGDPRVAGAKLWRDAQTGAPYLLELEFSSAARPPLAELHRSFGAFTDSTPTAIGAQRRVLFRAVAKGHGFVASIIAVLDGAPDRLEEATVASVAILRDIRVD